MIVYTDSTAGGKKTKRVELRYLYMQDLFVLSIVHSQGNTKLNSAKILTKYSPTEVLGNSTSQQRGIVDTSHSSDLFHADH